MARAAVLLRLPSVPSPPIRPLCSAASIVRSNRWLPQSEEVGIFAVNVLGSQDLELAERFAGGEIQGESRFDIGSWLELSTGAPVLESALAIFDCRLTRLEEVATHGILFGEIQAVRSRAAAAEALLYAHGAFGAFVPLADV